MSNAKKTRKIVNSISLGIMTALSSAAAIQPITASAADNVEEVNLLQNEEAVAVSQNQRTIDAMDAAGNAINNAQAEVVNQKDLQKFSGMLAPEDKVVILVAAFFGKTRLIDNIELN